MGMLVASLLGAGIVYAANGGPSAVDKKQLGLFSGNGDFIGTVLDVNVGYPSYNEPAGVNYTAYVSSLDAVVRINQVQNNESVLFDLAGAGPSGLLYFDSPNCAGGALIDTSIHPFVSSLSPQALVKHFGIIERFFVVESQLISARQSQSYIDPSNYTCVNANQSIVESAALREVTLPFTLVWPLTIKPL